MKHFHHKKKWGQNFLIDKNIIRKIINLSDIKTKDTVLEIGAGAGAMTSILASKVKKLIAVEIDKELIKYLDNIAPKTVDVINSDILKCDLSSHNNLLIVGNLPYNITTPIIFKFLRKRVWKRMIFMVQMEVGLRIVSKHNTKQYGRLSVMCQSYANINYEFTVSNNVFFPKPKVDSCVISFRPLTHKIKDDEKYETFVRLCFSNRRKLIKNNLRSLEVSDYPELLNKRPGELEVREFIDLANQIMK